MPDEMKTTKIASSDWVKLVQSKLARFIEGGFLCSGY